MAARQLKLVGVAALVLVAVGGLVWSLSSFLGDSQNSHIPSDFPHPFIAPADNGHLDRVVVIRARMAPFGAQEIEGATRWPAWRCDSGSCPGRQGDQPYVFAYGDPQQGASSACPACLAAEAPDPTDVKPYATPEGEAILSEVRARY